MIVCSCTGITSADIDRTVRWMRAADPDVMITPGKVYRALGRRLDCGGCARLFVEHIHKRSDGDVPSELRRLRDSRIERTPRDEGRPEGHRVLKSRIA